MAEAQSNPVKVLCDEILAQARRDAEEIARRARDQAQTTRDAARAEANRSRDERLRLARAEAARRKELILATVPMESARLDAVRRETLLESIHQELQRRLAARQGFDYEQTVINLVVNAISRMAGETFTIRLSASDAAVLGGKLREESAQRLGRPVTISIEDDLAFTEGGALIQGADGHQLWDNRLLVRLERLWPQLRQQIAIRTGLLNQPE